MGKFLAVFFYSILSFTAFAQVTKLPTYAIKLQYDIDAVRDTLSPKAGGVVIPIRPVVKDSIIFHYNSDHQLLREQIWRTGDITKTGDSRQEPDTSRYFIDYKYDTQNRLLSIRYGQTLGSPHNDNTNYGNPFVNYVDRIVRIDSFAFDNYNKQLFYRRYDLYDIQDFNSNYMVINDGWENEYEYDNLGRITREKFYYWSTNTKVMKHYQGMYDLNFSYHYVGNSNKIQARTYYCYGIQPYPFTMKDSLFTYDVMERVNGCKQFGYPAISPNVADYSSQTNFKDSIFYFTGKTGHEILYGNECRGVIYDKNGRRKYTYFGSKGPFKEYCNYKEFELSGEIFAIFGETSGPIVANRKYAESSNNILSKDSAYQYSDYDRLQPSTSGFRFDTTAYYGFIDITTSITDPLYSSEYIFDIFPNPAKEYITIVTNDLSGILHIYDINGIINISEEIIKMNTILDTSRLQTGIYIIELNGHRKKLVVR